MNLTTGLALTGLTFLSMEFVAWVVHRYLLHGPLWFVHRSHHVRHPHRFERNDLSFVFYGALSVLLMVYGGPAKDWRFWVGGGIAAYGTLYFFVHDVLIHRRLPFWKRTHNTYLRALNMAHKVHHRTTGRDGSEEFGLLWVSAKYFALARRVPVRDVRPGRRSTVIE